MRVRPSRVPLARLVAQEEAQEARLRRPVGARLPHRLRVASLRLRRPLAARLHRPAVRPLLLRQVVSLLLRRRRLRRVRRHRRTARRLLRDSPLAVRLRPVAATAAAVAPATVVATRLRPGRPRRDHGLLLSRLRSPRLRVRPLRSRRLPSPRLRSLPLRSRPRSPQHSRRSRHRLAAAGTRELPVTVCARRRRPSAAPMLPSVGGDGREGRRADFPLGNHGGLLVRPPWSPLGGRETYSFSRRHGRCCSCWYCILTLESLTGCSYHQHPS